MIYEGPAAQNAAEFAPLASERHGSPQVPDHELWRRIGAGSYGAVWLARNIMGTYRAVKVIYRDTFDSQRPYEREFAGIQKFEPVSRSHESQVNVLQVGRNDDAGYFYYVMELADDSNAECGMQNAESREAGGPDTGYSILDTGSKGPTSSIQHPLSGIHPDTYVPKTLRSELQRRRRLPFDECLRISLSLTTALEHLHRHGLVHRDIKPSNVIFVNGRPKLADIGLVAEVGKTMSFVGTEGFVPPEGPGTPQADLYSLGKVLYEISTGKDRLEFPEWPTDLEAIPDEHGLIELNEVLVKACLTDPRQRYQSAAAMHADLLLLQSGKSVKRLHSLERRLALATRIGIVAIGLAVLAAAGYYSARRTERAVTKQLVRLSVANGQHLMDEGDVFGALLWFTETLRLEQGNPEREAINRMRIAWLLRQCPKLRQSWFHDGPINRLEFSPNGQWLAVASDEGVARVWDIASGQAVTPPLHHSKGALCASFSPDGTRLVTGSRDGMAQIWALPGGKPMGAPMEHRWPGWFAEFSPDGQQVLIASYDTSGERPVGEAKVWDAATSAPVMTLAQAFVRRAFFSPDGRRILTMGADKTARIWNASTGQPATPVMLHPADVRDGSFSADGQRVVTVCADAAGARVWNALTGEPITPALAHENRVRHAKFSPDGKQVITASDERVVRVWDAGTGQLAMLPIRHKRPVRDASFTVDGRFIMTRGEDQVIRLWDRSSGELAMPEIKSSGPITRVLPCRDGRWMAFGGRDGGIRLWDLSGEQPALLLEDSVRLEGASYGGLDGRLIITRAGDSALVWNVQTGQLAFRLPTRPSPPGGRMRVAVFAGGGRRILTIWSFSSPSGQPAVRWEASVWDTVGLKEIGPPLVTATSVEYFLPYCYGPDLNRAIVVTNQQAQVWDVRTGLPLTPPLQHAGSHVYSCFSVDGRQVFTVGRDNTAELWNAETGEKVGVMLKYSSILTCLSINPNGRQIIVGAADGSAHIVDIKARKTVVSLLKHSGGVRQVLFNHDGKRALTVGADGSVGIWDVATGQLVAPFLKNISGETILHFGQSGSVLSAIGQEGALQLWDARTGDSITPHFKWPVPAAEGEFSPDGRHLAVSCSDGKIRIWESVKDERPVADLILLAELYAEHRIDAQGGFTPLSNAALSNAWQTLRQRYPGQFKPTQREPEAGLRQLRPWNSGFYGSHRDGSSRLTAARR
ncbi:MAG: protein kinase [Verrucomicrobiota bacterium]